MVLVYNLSNADMTASAVKVQARGKHRVHEVLKGNKGQASVSELSATAFYEKLISLSY